MTGVTFAGKSDEKGEAPMRPTDEYAERGRAAIELHHFDSAPRIGENGLEICRNLSVGVNAEPRELGVMRKERIGEEEDREV